MNDIKYNRSKFFNSAEYVDKKCLYCEESFKIKKSYIKHGKGKYCSRKCCDLHKKIIRIGENNGAYGRIVSENEKNLRSEITKKNWKNTEIRNKRLNGIKKFVTKHGYYPGTNEDSIDKRKKTLLEKYGVDHNWKSLEIRKKCDDTCVLKYGKTTYEIAQEALKLCKTNIEKIIENILIKNNINYIYQYKIDCGDYKKIYDFYLPDKNILIEADGDFWHGNPKKYQKTNLFEIQLLNQRNDLEKNNIAKEKGFKLLRFWENDIVGDNFEEILKKLL
jgi:very-short-patch-repair endonuclease